MMKNKKNKLHFLALSMLLSTSISMMMQALPNNPDATPGSGTADTTATPVLGSGLTGSSSPNTGVNDSNNTATTETTTQEQTKPTAPTDTTTPAVGADKKPADSALLSTKLLDSKMGIKSK